MTQPNPNDYWTGPAQWLFSPQGYPPGSVMFIGPVLWPAGIDPGNTSTAMCVFGPGGGSIQVPPLAAGQPGPTPVLRDVNVSNVPYGSALPTPQATWVQVSPGGPGVPAVYDLDIAIQDGQPGTVGQFLISAAQDLLGTLTNLYTITWNSVEEAFLPTPLPFTEWFNVPTIAPTTTAAGQVRTLASVTITPPTSAVVPIVFASAEVSGTANTQVDLVARLGGGLNLQTGVEIGRGFGQLGTSPAPATIIPAFDGSPGAAQIAANATPTIYLNAEQQQSTNDEYSTGRVKFTVGLAPISGS